MPAKENKALLRAISADPWSEAGVDEVGRGCLFGPVLAAAVILPPDFNADFKFALRDSKKMSEKSRNAAAGHIREVAKFGIGIVSAADIDRTNILHATMHAMQLALADLVSKSVDIRMIAVDGDQFDGFMGMAHRCVVKGDDTYMHIAAASVLAKTTRDAMMVDLARKYPGYDVENNKGYGTKAHIDAISRLGYTPEHRRSFNVAMPKKSINVFEQ